jgi:hypothetical protein
MKLSQAIFAISIVTTQSAFAQIAECDLLASSPMDPQKQSAGVSYSKIDHIAAVPACKIAITENKQAPRLWFQYGRALEKAKKIPDVYTALKNFRNEVHKRREIIQDLVSVFKAKGYEIWGVGASTKGNTLLQYCNLDKNSITAIAEVNSYKFDRFTPGSGIPIKSEQAMLRAMPEIGIVLPWHFKSTIIAGNQEYLNAGGKLVFPLPNIDIVR